MRVSNKSYAMWIVAGTVAGGTLLVPARAQTSSGPAAFADQLRQIEQGRDHALVTGDKAYLERFIADL